MATRSKFNTFLGLVPEVQCANPHTITLPQKVMYTMVSLFIFLAARQIPLYGIQLKPDQLYWDYPLYRENLILASNYNTLLTLGIGPILVPEVLKQFLVVVMNVKSNSPKAHTLLNRIQKLMGILTTISGVVAYILKSGGTGKFGSGNAALIALQILFSGIIIIYLDDVLKKGYGLVSCISLVTAANICGNVFWKAFSPVYFRYQGKSSIEYEGAAIAWVHLLITKRDMLSALHEAFFRQNLPNVINLLATCIFFPIAIFFQGLSFVLPVKTDIPGFEILWLIKISKISYGSIILHHLVATTLYDISKLLYMNYGGNKLVVLLGAWKGSKRPVPDGGLAYYIAAPLTLSNLHKDPLGAFIYVVFVLVSCALSAVFCLTVCSYSKRFRYGFLVLQDGQYVYGNSDSVPKNDLMSHVVKAAFFGGLCVGALIILGDLIGVFCCGTGIMLVVTTLYPYFDGRAGDVGVFGF